MHSLRRRLSIEPTWSTSQDLGLFQDLTNLNSSGFGSFYQLEGKQERLASTTSPASTCKPAALVRVGGRCSNSLMSRIYYNLKREMLEVVLAGAETQAPNSNENLCCRWAIGNVLAKSRPLQCLSVKTCHDWNVSMSLAIFGGWDCKKGRCQQPQVLPLLGHLIRKQASVTLNLPIPRHADLHSWPDTKIVLANSANSIASPESLSIPVPCLLWDSWNLSNPRPQRLQSQSHSAVKRKVTKPCKFISSPLHFHAFSYSTRCSRTSSLIYHIFIDEGSLGQTGSVWSRIDLPNSASHLETTWWPYSQVGLCVNLGRLYLCCNWGTAARGLCHR